MNYIILILIAVLIILSGELKKEPQQYLSPPDEEGWQEVMERTSDGYRYTGIKVKHTVDDRSVQLESI